MNEATFRKLDACILNRLTAPGNVSIEVLSELTFTLFASLKPLRISSWQRTQNGGVLLGSYGTDVRPFDDTGAFLESISGFIDSTLESQASLVDVSEPVPFFVEKTRSVGVVSAESASRTCIIALEFDHPYQCHEGLGSFLQRLASYLCLFTDSLERSWKEQCSLELQYAFHSLPGEFVLLSHDLSILDYSDEFSLREDLDMASTKPLSFPDLLRKTDREAFSEAAFSSLTRSIAACVEIQLASQPEQCGARLTITPVSGNALLISIERGSHGEAVLAEEQKLALFTTLNPFPVIQFDATGHIMAANPAARRYFPIEERPSLALLVPQYANDELRSCIENGSIISKTYTAADRTFQFVARGAPGLQCGILYGIDITERVKAEEQLANSHTFLRKIIDSNPNLIFVKDTNGRFTLANQTVADIYNTTIEEIVGKTDSDFNPHADEVENFRKDDLEVVHFQKEIIINEESVTDASGSVRWLQTVKKPIRTLNNEIHVLGVGTDVTALKQLQAQLTQSQKLEAVGQLAGGIAHDFNNLLTGILGYTNLLLLNDSGQHDVQHPARMIEKACLQASALTQKLLGFARKGKHQNIAVDIHETVREVVQLLERTVEENIQIRLHLDSEAARVLGDPVQLQQIFLNLVINARDAIQSQQKAAGSITIASRCITEVDAAAVEDVSLERKQYLQLSVRDNGCGIAEHHIDKIFEPFFTTKDPSRGTGMGLAMVYGIVENHGGRICVDSTEGVGSTFHIYLPITESVPESLAAKVTTSTPGKGQILLVDDHRMIRDVTSQMLSNLGYEVVTANNGIEALEYYREHSFHVDLIILDMVMPKMGALECFQRFQAINPDVRVILSTGYVNNNRVQEILNEGMVGFVQKPYHLHELSKVVADALRPAH